MCEYPNDIIAGLSDAGCSQAAIARAEWLLEVGRTEDLIKQLRRCRCDLIDQKHESQKRIDRVDYLIRQAERIIAAK